MLFLIFSPMVTRFLLLLLAAAGPAAFGSTPAVVGRWLGTAGTPEDTAVFGLEITADEKDGLAGFVYLDQLNYYGARLPEFEDAGEARFKIPAMGIELTLAGDRLSGSLFGGRLPVNMTRSEQLPTEPEPPQDVPRGPEPRWQTKLDGAIYATAATRGPFVYVGTTGGRFYAINAADGNVAWTFDAGGAIFGEALATDDAVYFVCDNGRLYKLARDTGRKIWDYDLGDAEVPRVLPAATVYEYDYRAPRPLLVEGVIYVGAGNDRFHAINANSGEQIWRIATQGKVRTDAVAAGSTLVYTTLGGQLCAVERATGRELWHQDYKGALTSSPVISGGRLFVGGRDSQLRALQPETGAPLWQRGFWGSWVESSPVVAGDVFYIGSSDLRRVSCRKVEDGHFLWRTDVFGFAWGRPLLTDRHVYIGTSGAQPYMIRHRAALSVLDRVTGRLVARWPLPDSDETFMWGFVASPVANDRTLVIGALDGVFYGFPLEEFE